MDQLTQLLLQRQMAQPPTQSTPVVPPSGGTTHTPPEAKRFATAQAMMAAYRGGWQPNPMILQAQSK